MSKRLDELEQEVEQLRAEAGQLLEVCGRATAELRRLTDLVQAQYDLPLPTPRPSLTVVDPTAVDQGGAARTPL